MLASTSAAPALPLVFGAMQLRPLPKRALLIGEPLGRREEEEEVEEIRRGLSERGWGVGSGGRRRRGHASFTLPPACVARLHTHASGRQFWSNSQQSPSALFGVVSGWRWGWRWGRRELAAFVGARSAFGGGAVGGGGGGGGDGA